MTARTLLMVLLLASTSSGAEVVGEWTTGDEDEVRRVVVDGTTASFEVTWPTTGDVVTVVGVARGGHAFLREVAPETPGLVGALEGRRAEARPVRSVEVRVTREDDDGGAHADAVLREGSRFVAVERWRRAGRPALDLLALRPQVGWCPKDGPLTVRFRVRNAPASLRLRVIVAPSGGEAERRRVEFYVGKLSTFERRPTRRIVRELRLNGGAPFEPGEHEVTYDGRDGTGDERLLLGGGYWVALLGDDDVDLRVEDNILVAPPRTEYVGPRWPKRVGPDGEETDPGRNRGSSHAMISSKLEDLGLGRPAASLLGGVTTGDATDAMRRAAQVTVATHGAERALTFYTAPDDEVERPEHVDVLGYAELDALGAAGGASDKPLADLHSVIVWACLAGKRELPGRLVALGADVVVAFTTSIHAGGEARFVTHALAKSLAASEKRAHALMSVREVSRLAAHEADQVWRDLERDDPAEYARLWAHGVRPLETEGVLRIETAPGIDPEIEPLAPGRWGCRTN